MLRPCFTYCYLKGILKNQHLICLTNCCCLSFTFNKLSLAETLCHSHYVRTCILDSLDSNTNISQDEGLLKGQHDVQNKEEEEKEILGLRPTVVWKHPASTTITITSVLLPFMHHYVNVDAERLLISSIL